MSIFAFSNSGATCSHVWTPEPFPPNGFTKTWLWAYLNNITIVHKQRSNCHKKNISMNDLTCNRWVPGVIAAPSCLIRILQHIHCPRSNREAIILAMFFLIFPLYIVDSVWLVETKFPSNTEMSYKSKPCWFSLTQSSEINIILRLPHEGFEKHICNIEFKSNRTWIKSILKIINVLTLRGH